MGMYCEIMATSRDTLDHGFGINASDGFFDRNTATTDGISLEKTWHGLHYLLTGDAWAGQGPLAFLLAGGEPLDPDDQEGPKWFEPEQTAAIFQALSGISNTQLWSRFDAKEMEELDIYPGAWDEDEEDLREEYVSYFSELKRLIGEAVQHGHGLLVSIG